ncbi:ribonuclease pancreatic delta-type [Rattus rattus]|uniref:ribonuclease pancreatic delta-type n=1 Tax=Rattus rattus TaxID=10117 RepID=UPI0013F30062|nr:ribonuclease pancreatic delta-type [Rattus rattus]
MGLEKSLLLFSLLVLVLGWVQPSLGRKPSVQDFKRQHMDPGSPPNSRPTYCNQMMKRRGMTKGSCKRVNTFLHESWAKVQAICSQRQMTCKTSSKKNCHKSSSPLHITECRLKGSSKYPKCDYTTTNSQKHIIIACEGNPLVPVHYDASV